MPVPTFDDFPSAPCGPGRLYRVTDSVDLAAFWLDAPLPHAPAGFLVYVLIEGDRVGAWEWCSGAQELHRVMRAFRATTSPDYVPPQWEAPGGELATIRPPIRDFLRHAMEHGRPDPSVPEPPSWLEEFFPLETGEP